MACSSNLGRHVHRTEPDPWAMAIDWAQIPIRCRRLSRLLPRASRFSLVACWTIVSQRWDIRIKHASKHQPLFVAQCNPPRWLHMHLQAFVNSLTWHGTTFSTTHTHHTNIDNAGGHSWNPIAHQLAFDGGILEKRSECMAYTQNGAEKNYDATKLKA